MAFDRAEAGGPYRLCSPTWPAYILLNSLTNTFRFAYKRQNVNDGNFKAQNLHSSRPDQDVCLYDGEGYMVAEKPYQEYLVKVPSRKEVRFEFLLTAFSGAQYPILILDIEIYM